MIEKAKNWWQSLDDKNKQNSKSILIVLAIVVIGYFFLEAIDNKNVNDNKLAEESEIDLSAAKGDYSIEESWLERSELKLEEIQDELKSKQAENQKIQKELDDLNLKIDSFFDKDQTEDIRRDVDSLKKIVNKTNNKPSDSSGSYINNSSEDPFSQGGGQGARNNNQYFKSNNNSTNQDLEISRPREVELVYHNKAKLNKNSCKPPVCLPAYSYAAGVLISTADVVTGVTAQSNPKPVLIKIITEAVSVKDPTTGKFVKTDLRECKIGGRITAELSSERGNVVLDKMVCSDKDGGTIETEIEGYVADLSKHGISGKVVRREGDLITKSFLAGMVGGLGAGLSTKFQQGVKFQDGFASSGDISNKDIALQGLGRGIEKSSITVEQYLIKRAEQYQPTIETSAGKLIEVIFISKAYLDGRRTKDGNEESQKSHNSNSNINTY